MHTKGYIDPATASIYSPANEETLKALFMRFEYGHFSELGAPQMKIWYLAHPVLSDDQYTVEENLVHVLVVQKILHEMEVFTIVPWYTWVKLYGAEEDTLLRTHMLDLKCGVVKRLGGRIVLTGHKMAEGMLTELKAAMTESTFEVTNLIGIPDDQLKLFLETEELPF